MSHEFRINSRVAIHFLLERKNHEHLVDDPADLLDPAFAPRPNLRADVIDNGTSRLSHAFGEAQIEVREVDENGGRGRVCLYSLRKPPEHAIKSSKRAENFERTDNGGLANVAFQLHTGRLHPLAAEAVNVAAGKSALEAPRDFGAIHVA